MLVIAALERQDRWISEAHLLGVQVRNGLKQQSGWILDNDTRG